MDSAVYLPDCIPSASPLSVISSSSNVLTGAGFKDGVSDCAVSANARLPSVLTPRNVLRFIRFPFKVDHRQECLFYSQAGMPILLGSEAEAGMPILLVNKTAGVRRRRRCHRFAAG